MPCLLNFVREGLAKLEPTYASLRMPLLLLNSPQDVRERMKVVLEPKGEHVLEQPPGQR